MNKGQLNKIILTAAIFTQSACAVEHVSKGANNGEEHDHNNQTQQIPDRTALNNSTNNQPDQAVETSNICDEAITNRVSQTIYDTLARLITLTDQTALNVVISDGELLPGANIALENPNPDPNSNLGVIGWHFDEQRITWTAKTEQKNDQLTITYPTTIKTNADNSLTIGTPAITLHGDHYDVGPSTYTITIAPNQTDLYYSEQDTNKTCTAPSDRGSIAEIIARYKQQIEILKAIQAGLAEPN
jgi:hypothetical protein